MTEKELSRYYHLKKEIRDLEERIIKFGDGVGAVEITDMPKGSASKDTIQQKIAELRDKYIELRLSALEEYIKIETYINTNVDDPEIRTMMRKRFLDLMNWEEIGREYYCDRTTASRKVHKYIIELAHNAR